MGYEYRVLDCGGPGRSFLEDRLSVYGQAGWRVAAVIPYSLQEGRVYCHLVLERDRDAFPLSEPAWETREPTVPPV